jgi:sugar/nucleoside kinase (ribokinase family)
MQTYLGACQELGPEDIDPDLVCAAQVIYLEGYLFDPPLAQEAFRKAATLAHQAGRKVALTLSDPFCVERHREAFQDLVEHHVDILFANEAEIRALWQTDLKGAIAIGRGRCEVLAITRSEKGSIVLAGDDLHEVPAAPVDRVVDTTGAGDLYAAGFLFGYTNGRDLRAAARIGSLAAAEVISHFGARPEVPLSEQLESAGL